MAPARKQPNRAPASGSVNAVASTAYGAHRSSRYTDALLDFQSRRVQRRLEELERTNPTDIPAQSFVPSSHAQSSSPHPHPHTQAGTPSNPTPTPLPSAAQKKKMSANVRRVLYSRKTLKDWLDELPPTPRAPYLTAPSPAPAKPARKLCSSCGYRGAYSCPKCAEWSCDRACAEVHARDGGCGVAS